MEIHCLLQQKNNREGWEKMETASNAYLSYAVFAEEKAAKGEVSCKQASKTDRIKILLS